MSKSRVLSHERRHSVSSWFCIEQRHDAVQHPTCGNVVGWDVLTLCNELNAMLANLLPGIRDIRTPLATGYLWLLTLWFWIPSHFKDAPPTSGIPGDVTRLGHYAGRAGVGVAISFVAYLVGVLSKSLNPPLVRLGTFNTYIPTLFMSRFSAYLPPRTKVRFLDFWRRSFSISLTRDSEDEREKALEEFDEQINLVTGQLSRSGLYSLQNFSLQMADRGEIRKDTQSTFYRYLLSEVPRLGNALVGREADLYSVYDRLISEYEFRIGIGVPLIALVVTLADRWSLLWLLTLLPLLVLLSTGSQQRMAAGDLLADAVRLRRIDVALPPEVDPQSVQP